MVNMNMIVNTSELVGYEAETKTTKASGTQALAKLIATWEKKQANAKRIGGLGLLAVSLAACNSDDDSAADAADAAALAAVQAQLTAALAAQATAEAAQATAEAAQVTAEATTATAAVVASSNQTFTYTTGVETFTGGDGDDNFNSDTAAKFGMLDGAVGGGGNDTLSISDATNAAYALPTSSPISGVEHILIAHTASAGGHTVTADVSLLTDLDQLTVTNSGTATTMDIDSNGNITAVTLNGGTASITTANILDSGTAATATVAGTDALASVSLTGFTGATTLASDVLDTLSLKTVKGVVTNTDAYTASTRTLAVNTSGDLTGGGVTDAGADAININADAATTGNATFTFATATTVDINAENALTWTNVDMSAAGKTATISGDSLVTGSVDVLATGTLAISGSAGYKDTGTFPGVTVTNSGSGATTLGATTATAGLIVGATFTGGSGVDTITFGAATKANTMGAGKDIAYFTGSALGTAGSVDLGDAVDTVGLTFANAVTASATELFEKAVTNFEALNLRTTAAGTVNVANLNSVDAITLEGALTHAIALSGLPEAATVTQKSTNTSGLTYSLADATGTADSLNLTMSNVATTAFGSSTAASIETINITSTDADVLAANQTAVHTATLAAANATSVVVTGNAGLNLTSTASTAVTSFDASAVTGLTSIVTYTSANVTAGKTPVIKGGAAPDVLTGASLAETIEGGAGNDTIEGNTGVDTLTGGAGNDTFNFVTVELLGTDIVSGGDGTDVISVTDATNTTNVVDADFTNMTGVETLLLVAGQAHTVVLGASSLAAGIKTVTATGAGTNSMTVGAGHAGTISLTGGSGTDTFTVSGVPAGHTVTIGGGNGTNGYTIGPATDVITGGNGADTITVTAPASLSSADVIAGGTGTDIITFGATATITDSQFTGVSAVETINTADAVTTLTLAAQATEAGIATVNLGDVADGSQNTLDLSAKTTATAVNGGSGSDVITGSAQAETLDTRATANSGTGVDTFILGATGALNGTDVLGRQGVTYDQATLQLDFSAFSTNLSFNTTVVQDNHVADINMTNGIVLLDDNNGGIDQVDGEDEVAALIQGIGNSLHMNSGGKGIVIAGSNGGSVDLSGIFYVDDTLDGVNGNISTADVKKVMTFGDDLDDWTAGNFL
jgi:S-layer protein